MIWGDRQRIALTCSQPVKPRRNAHVERYSRAVQHEWLDLQTFETIEEAQQIATECLGTSSNKRPDMDIAGVTPPMKLKISE